jgi:hypothetical protein
MDERDASFGNQQFSATDTLKKRIIDYIFRLCEMATNKEEQVSIYGYETGFIRGTTLAKSLLWKYIPTEIRNPIKECYDTLETEIKRIDADEKMGEDVKMLNKKRIADSMSMQVLEFLLVVLLYSPMSTEFADAEVFKDFKNLISAVRQKEPVKLFSGEVKE